VNLPEVYFYMVIVLFQLFSLVIITFSEDLKVPKYYKRYFRITFIAAFAGVIMELANWNYLCRFNCTLLTSSPFLTLNIVKGVMEFFRIKREPFSIYWGKLSDGIWVKNKGDLKFRNYYALYTICILIMPIHIIFALYYLIEKLFCWH